MTGFPTGDRPTDFTELAKGKITLDKNDNSASMEVTWKGHRIQLKVHYDSSNFDESQASKDLGHTLDKLLEMHAPEKIKESEGLFEESFRVTSVNAAKTFSIQNIGSLEQAKIKNTNLALEKASHGSIDQNQVIERLAGQSPGTYLLRSHSTEADIRIISYVNENKGIGHIIQRPIEDQPGQYQVTIKDNKKTINGIGDIFEDPELSNLLKYPFSSETTVPKLTPEKMLELAFHNKKERSLYALNDQPKGTFIVYNSQSDVPPKTIIECKTGPLNFDIAYIVCTPSPTKPHAFIVAADINNNEIKKELSSLSELFTDKDFKDLMKTPLIPKSDIEAFQQVNVANIAKGNKLYAEVINQNLSFSAAKKIVSKQGKGKFAVCQDPGSSTLMIVFKNSTGELRTVPCTIHSPGFEVNGNYYKEFYDFCQDPIFEKQLKAICEILPNPIIPKLSIDYKIIPSTMSEEEIAKQTPDELLCLIGKGVSVSAEHILSITEKITGGLPQAAIDNPSILTTLHKLYDKAAEILIEEGRINEAFKARAMAAEKIVYPDTHPLHQMNQAIAKGAGKQKIPDFGAHFSEMDSGTVKGGNLRAWTRRMEGKETNCFEFKLCPYARNDFQYMYTLIQQNQEEFKNSLPGLLRDKEMTLTTVPQYYRKKNEEGDFSTEEGINPWYAQAIQIEFKGIGKVHIGNSPEVGCMINEVNVELDAELPAGEGLKALHQMMAVLGCGPVVGAQREEDRRRLQVAQIFRAYFPKHAICMEQAKEFYELPVDDLIEKIHQEFPEVKDSGIFQKYLKDHPELLKLEEIYPGRSIWCLADLAEQIKEKGGIGLMQGVGQSSFNDAVDSLIPILTKGNLSTQDRFLAGLIIYGASSSEDLASGGGDQSFTRMITKNLENKDINEFRFHGNIQVLWDMSVVNRVSYGFEIDTYGVKNTQDKGYLKYASRQNLMELAETLKSDAYLNEVMVKNRMAPDFIRGLVVQSDEERERLIDRLKNVEGLITLESGEERINGLPLDKFIYTAKQFGRHMWEKS